RMAASADDLDPFLILADANGYELARNDDSTSATKDAAIADFVLPVDGTYLVRATRYGFANGPSAGDYTLVIETGAEPIELGTEGTPTPLDYGTAATGALDLDHPGAGYTFTGRAGDRVTISVQRTSGDLDLALVLRGPDGAEIVSKYAWTVPGEARIARLALPADGTYAVEVLLNDLTTSGTYRVIALAEPSAQPSAGAFEPAPGLDIEVVLIWSSGADLDLAITDPEGQPDSLVTARANDFCADVRPAPVERVVWNQGTAAPGLYRISVDYRLNCTGQGDPVPFILAVVRHGEVEFVGGTLAQEGDAYTTLLDSR
ncbi:MAG TPA: PPC domain-containing protein, partial [Aggregatilineaceae bacterium]|nr:PPC domain-containing protein [Aggregatilineaceae bacterium]